ncbi:MAG: peptidylprolyl isomerase [Bryobacteraceae bacterium]|nr:peptidylprolyl isomerase [Bryobacteraceae bacterium]
MRVIAILAALLALTGCGAAPEPVRKAEAPKPAPMPDVYRVKFETSKGDVVLEVRKQWAPRAAARFYELVTTGYYDGSRFHRVIRNYVAQFGIHRDPKISQLWRELRFPDEPVRQSNRKGWVSFAQLGPNTRNVQAFINLRDNRDLDKQGFPPFAQVVEGMDAVERLYSSYGELQPKGGGPDGVKAELQGNAYLETQYPRLDYIIKASVVP